MTDPAGYPGRYRRIRASAWSWPIWARVARAATAKPWTMAACASVPRCARITLRTLLVWVDFERTGLCKRSDNDPLVRVLTDRYKLNILRQPRRGVGVGELLIGEGRDFRCAGPVSGLFDPQLVLPPQESAALPDVEGVTSLRRSADAAGAPLAGLLTALGVAGVSSVRASLHAARDVSVAYSLTGVGYRWTDLVSLGAELPGHALREENAVFRPGRDYFVAYAVAEATGIKVSFSLGTDHAGSLASELAGIISADASVDVASDRSGHLAISGDAPVTFGLAVVELKADGNRFWFKPASRARAVRGESPGRRSREDVDTVFFGGLDGDALVEVG
jgi:catechol 2,3-dioxygenase-like lactoylglutathione lyase family enzyme